MKKPMTPTTLTEDEVGELAEPPKKKDSMIVCAVGKAGDFPPHTPVLALTAKRSKTGVSFLADMREHPAEYPHTEGYTLHEERPTYAVEEQKVFNVLRRG